jgi:hypothetical protein
MGMRLNKLAVAAILLFLTAVSVEALTMPYETTTVSRIVGDDVASMKRQLEGDKLMDLQNSVYAASDAFDTPLQPLAREIFPTTTAMSPPITASDLESKLTTEQLIYIKTLNENPSSMQKIQTFDAGEAAILKDELAEKDSLIILDSPSAGLYLPGETSFAGVLSPYANMIAPTSFYSTLFTKSLLCNLGRHSTLGETFRQARNNYYYNTGDVGELLGLVIQSYSLFGLPNKGIKTPKLATSSACSNYRKDYIITANDAFSISESGSTYTKEFTFEIGNHSVAQYGDYVVIETSNTENMMRLFDFALPERTLVEELPANTIITNLEPLELSDPVDITINNLPMWNISGLVARECYETARNASITFSHTYTDTSLLVLTHINPVEIIDCSSGQLRLYRTARYKISYVPYSPLLIETIAAPDQALPGQALTINVNVKNVGTNPLTGYLILKDDEENTITAEEVTAAKTAYTLLINAPEQEGHHQYVVHFVNNNASMTYKTFNIEVKTLDVELFVPESVQSTVQAELFVTNKLSNAIATNITYHLMQNGNIEQSGTISANLAPGQNKFSIQFDGLEKDKSSYDVIVEIPYLNTHTSATSTIITEHAPVIVQSNIMLHEGELLVFEPLIYDLDGDAITTDIEYPFKYNEGWTPSYDESGTYTVRIIANDGIKQTEKTIIVEVVNTNRPPSLNSSEIMKAEEGQTFVIAPYATDPDNQNKVTNDDNQLTFTYGWLLDDKGTYWPSYDSAGTFIVPVTVSDGEFTDTKNLTIQIANTNRPPRISLPDMIASDYDIDLAPYVNASDPDNENDDPSDDNQLSIIYAQPFDSNGRWMPPQPGIVFTTVKVTDGEFTVGKDIWINVSATHPMPQPPYTYPEYNNTPPVEEPPANITENQTTTPPANLTPETSQQQNQTANETPTQTSTPAPQPVAQTTTNGLEIEITAKADGRTKKVNGDTSLSVEPDSEVKLKISLKNNGNTTKKITVEAEIDELDQKEKETVTLKPDDDEELKYEFFIPRLTEDDKYRLEITIRENGIRLKKTLALKLDKPPHELSIRKAKAEACDDNGRITIRLENTGSNKEKGTLRLESKSLNLDRRIPFSLDEGKYKAFSEPFLVEKGTHTITITAEYNSRSITKEIRVEKC